jgi:hypothetical protein
MAARTKPLHPIRIEEMRKKIQTTLLIKRLENHAFGELELSASQIKATEILLNKSIPNLSQQNIDANINHTGLAGVLAGLGGGSKDNP